VRKGTPHLSHGEKEEIGRNGTEGGVTQKVVERVDVIKPISTDAGWPAGRAKRERKVKGNARERGGKKRGRLKIKTGQCGGHEILRERGVKVCKAGGGGEQGVRGVSDEKGAMGHR